MIVFIFEIVEEKLKLLKWRGCYRQVVKKLYLEHRDSTL